MAVSFLERFASFTATALRVRVYPNAVPIGYDESDDKLKFLDDNGTNVRKVVSEDQTQTLTNKTLTSPTLTTPTLTTPTITAPSGSASTGLRITKSARFVEDSRAGTYTATIALPAGAILHDIKVIAEVLWNGTSATAKIGDTADDDGYFTGVNLKATDLLVGEVLSIIEDGLWGGKEGAYLVAATGRRGPAATNFGLYYAAGSNITMIVTPGAADGTAGRTVFSVEYSVGEVTSVA